MFQEMETWQEWLYLALLVYGFMITVYLGYGFIIKIAMFFNLI